MPSTQLCNLKDIPENGAKGMIATVNGKQRNIFIIRKEGRVFAYINWCPHNQVLIDQIPGRFFNEDNSLIQCSKHGALFRIEDGYCVEGPCQGERLQRLPCESKNGSVLLLESK